MRTLQVWELLVNLTTIVISMDTLNLLLMVKRTAGGVRGLLHIQRAREVKLGGALIFQNRTTFPKSKFGTG